MIAGATTKASTAMGTVTEAQMPRILGREYCAGVRRGASRRLERVCRGHDLSLGRDARSAHPPLGSRSWPVPYAARVMLGVRLQGDARWRRATVPW